MKTKYAGAAWNALMEEETKESIAEMLLDAWDELRELRKDDRLNFTNAVSSESLLPPRVSHYGILLDQESR